MQLVYQVQLAILENRVQVDSQELLVIQASGVNLANLDKMVSKGKMVNWVCPVSKVSVERKEQWDKEDLLEVWECPGYQGNRVMKEFQGPKVSKANLVTRVPLAIVVLLVRKD